MTSISYDEIYSSFFARVKAYKLAQMPQDYITELSISWLHSISAQPFIRRLFSSFKYDDEVQVINFEMKYPAEEDYDRDFIIDIFSLGMVIKWIEPKVNNDLIMTSFYGSKSEKWYSEANMLNALQGVLTTAKNEQRNLIRDRVYFNNQFINKQGGA